MEKQILVKFLKEIDIQLKMVKRGLKSENEAHHELIGMYNGIKLALIAITPDTVHMDLHHMRTIIDHYFLGDKDQKEKAFESLQFALSVAEN